MASFISPVALTITFDCVLSMLIFITEEDTISPNSILAQLKKHQTHVTAFKDWQQIFEYLSVVSLSSLVFMIIYIE